MKTRKSTKRALLLSVCSIMLCLVMLIGTTFAWFTDTASIAVSTIQSGTLHVEIQGEDGKPVTELEWLKAEDGKEQEILWEPGCTYTLTPFKIVNTGKLALKYQIVITGLDGNAELLKVIEFTYKTADNKEFKINDEGHLKAGEATDMITVSAHMIESAGNEYQDKTLEGVSFTVYATQDTVEYDSNDNEYDKDPAYGSGVTIGGFSGTYDTLTAAAKAWRESKNVVTSGNQFGYNTLNGSVDSITWLISGEVATGDGEGVIGSNGAGQSILGGGYFTPAVLVNNVTIKGVNGAKITKTGENYLVSAGGNHVVYEDITFTDTVRIDSNPVNLTFKNCKFEAGLRLPHTAVNGSVTVENCTFTGNESSGYAIFAQGSMASFTITGSRISDCQRGINVQAGDNAVVTISNNTIQGVSGKTENGFTYGAAIQMSSMRNTKAKSFTVTGNIISDVAVNALHIYEGFNADSVVIRDNEITAAYLCWNQAGYTAVESSGNNLSITNEGYCVTKTAQELSNFVLN